MADDVKDGKKLTWEELAEACGVTRQSIVRWKHLEGAPHGRDVGEWKEFIKTRTLKDGGNLKEEKLKWEIELLRNRDARDKRLVIPADEVNTLLLHLSTQSRTILYQFMETEARPSWMG